MRPYMGPYFLGLIFWVGVAVVIARSCPTLGCVSLFLVLGYTIAFWSVVGLCRVAK